MNAVIFRKRLASIPIWHWLVALAIAGIAGTAAYWGWKQLPTDYLALSLLSYENPKQFLADHAPGETSTIEIANAILTTEQLNAIAAKAQFGADNDVAGEGGENSSGQALRAQMELEQPGPELLQITLHGRNPGAVLKAVNSISAELASWHAPAAVPAGAVNVAIPSPANATAAGSRQVANENLATLELQEAQISKRINELSAEEQRLEADAGDASAAVDPDAEQRAQLSSKIGAAKRHLAELPQEDADDADISSAQQALATLRHQYAMLLPLAAGASRADQLTAVVKQLAQLRLLRGTLADGIEAIQNRSSTQRPSPGAGLTTPAGRDSSHPENFATDKRTLAAPAISGGSFSVVAWGEGPHVMPNPQKTLLLWGGAAASLLLALGYLAIVYRRYRPVQDAAALMKAVPVEAQFLGVVSCGRIGVSTR